MLDPLSSVYLFLLLIYGCLLFYLQKAWFLIPQIGTPSQKYLNFTLLVPFRNEKDTLPGLVLNLKEVIPAAVQVIFINDHSEDGGYEWIKGYISSSGKTNWECIDSSGIGKKQALKEGISASKNSLIMTIDADVTLSRQWYLFMLEPFKDRDVQLVAGPVLVNRRNTKFYDFQLIEWASLVLVTGASFSMKNPVMCSGANLAFRKDAFLEVNGYLGNEHVLSGDDEFLLKKIHAHFGPEATKYLVNREALVLTKPMEKLSDWINQRARWAGKWNLHGWNAHAFSAFALVFFSVAHLSTIIALFFNWLILFWVFIYWFLKSILEWKVLGAVLNRFERQMPFVSYTKASILHPIMILATLPFAIFRVFTWKGRNN